MTKTRPKEVHLPTLISRIFPNRFLQICIISVSGDCMCWIFKTCQTVVTVSISQIFSCNLWWFFVIWNLCVVLHVAMLWSDYMKMAFSKTEKCLRKCKWHTMGQDRSKCKETLSHSEWHRFWIFGFFMYPYGSLEVPLVPKSHNTLVELFKFTRYVE